MISTIAWIALGCIAAAAILGVAYFFWISYSLLSGWNGDPFEHLPEHDRAIEKAQLEYEVADQLGYSGDVLLGLESKVCAARREAEEYGAAHYVQFVQTHSTLMPASIIVSTVSSTLEFGGLGCPLASVLIISGVGIPHVSGP